jgi:stage II sporulation protein D (peptidoglycan lytic transglycosylase)
MRAPAFRHAVPFLVALLFATCRPGEVPRTPPSPGDVTRPPVSPPVAPPDSRPITPRPTGSRAPLARIGVKVDTTAIAVGASTSFDVMAESGETTKSPASDVWLIRRSSGGLQAASASQNVHSDGPITIRAAGGTVRIGGTTYRGDATIIASRNGVTAINIVDLEEYLSGVVPREIGRRPPAEIEAVKAQAIAARTYAIGHRGARASLGFDYYAGTLDQVYGGMADEDSVANRAVLETRGEIVTYNGQPILAYYSSTCGGRTAAIEESWPWREPLPYLRSVSDQIPGSDDYYCSTSNRFRWTTTWTRTQLLAALGSTLRSYVGNRAPRRVDAFDITGRGESGRVNARLAVDGRRIALRADSVRWILRTPAGAILNSSRIDSVTTKSARDGSIDALSIHGGGWGHGIGMCQVGALGRARAGQSYDEILRTYYTGTEVTKLY